MTTALLDGIWVPTGATSLIDDKLGVATDPSGDPDWEAVPHGTYLPLPYLRVRTTCFDGLPDELAERLSALDEDEPDDDDVMAVELYDGQGALARFLWSGEENRWEADLDPVRFAIRGGSVASDGGGRHFDVPDLEIVRHPTLTLARWTQATAPHRSLDGEVHTTALGDGSAPVADQPGQRLEYDDSSHELLWIRGPWGDEPEVSLAFVLARGAAETASYPTGTKLGNPFGDPFIAQSLSRLAAPFYGYNPARMADYSSEALYQGLTPGTQPQNYESNPHQSFSGALVFCFPKADSYDYMQATDLPASPNVPFGVRPMAVTSRHERTHTSMVTTTRDQAHATSTTFGLSAGIDKVLEVKSSLAFERKSETSSKHQSRFTLSRKVAESWVAHLDLPSLRLHPELTGTLRSHLLRLLSSDPDRPSWGTDFVPRFGTHYAHALTLGAIEVAQTWFSLDSEIQATEKKVSLSEEASATVEGAKIGASFSLSDEWKEKSGLEVSTEDTALVGLGSDHDPAVIFHDLRPLSELMSPLFVPHEPADRGWGRFAPWVWYVLRPDFERYLTSIGWNQPLAPEDDRSFSPREFTVRIESFVLSGDHVAATVGGARLALRGKVVLSAADPHASPGPWGLDPDRTRTLSDAPLALTGAPFEGLELHLPPALTLGRFLTTADNVFAGAKGGLSLVADVDLYLCVEGMERVLLPVLEFKAPAERVDLPFSSATDPSGPKITWELTDTQHRMTLQITMRAVHIGPYGSDHLEMSPHA